MVSELFDDHLGEYAKLNGIKDSVISAANMLASTVESGGTIFTCGNGGSAADSEHIVGELLKSFKKPRKINDKLTQSLEKLPADIRSGFLENLEGGIKAISLMGHNSYATAFSNDKDSLYTVAQKLSVLGTCGDCVVLISTSGNSKNIVLTAHLAKCMGIKTIALTGIKESELSKLSDVTVQVPESEVHKIQEMHLPIYHFLCAYLEEKFF